MHLPKISLNEFLVALEGFFNIRFFIDEIHKTVRIVNIDNIVSSLDYVDFDKDILSISTELEGGFPGIMLSVKMDSGDSYCQSHLEPEMALFDCLKPEVDQLLTVLA